MVSLLKVSMRWTGFQGAPGYSNFYFHDFNWDGGGTPGNTQAAVVVGKVDTFAQGILGVLPAGVTLQVSGEAEEIDGESGDMLNIHTTTTPAARTPGHAAGPYSSPTGAVISWRTGGVRNGRRIRGRTFIVPTIGATFENNGSLTSTAISTITTAATALISVTGDGDMGVWARPTAPGATDGVWYSATGFSVPDMGAVLRSRRD